MRRRYKCGTCAGTYREQMPDGTLYYHACPPLSEDPAGAPIERPDKRDENVTVDAAGSITGIKAEGRGRTEEVV